MSPEDSSYDIPAILKICKRSITSDADYTYNQGSPTEFFITLGRRRGAYGSKPSLRVRPTVNIKLYSVYTPLSL